MEPIPNIPSTPTDAASSAWGELVVQKGWRTGTRWPLHAPLILIGRSEVCDFRLNFQRIAPIHCILYQTPTGPMLRDFHGGDSTLLNGKNVTQAPLQDGDLLAVGPFRFRVVITHGWLSEGVAAEREALRIQAAAVVAQQAALTEEESRLLQRRSALKQQEAQLAGHLEEKRRRLIELRNRLRNAHATLQQQQATHEQSAAETQRQLDAKRAELTEEQQQVRLDRRRLFDIYRRIKQRAHRHWMAERAAMRRREEEIARRQHALENERERLQQERDELYRQRLRGNGEIELGKRQVQDAWEQLRRARSQWEERRAREEAELKKRGRLLDQREADLIDAEHDLDAERQTWSKKRLDLERETEGLDIRIHNQRRKLAAHEQKIQRLEAGRLGTQPREEAAAKTPNLPVPASAADEVAGAVLRPGGACPDVVHRGGVPPRPPSSTEEKQPLQETDAQQRLAALEKLAEELADQRLHLAEQCQRLMQARQRWQAEREAVAAQLEPLGLLLVQREQALADRQRALETLEADHRRRREEAAETQRQLDAWQARLAVRAASWQGERDRLLADAQSREQLAERHLAAVAKLRDHWQQRRRREVERLQALLAVGERLRQECAGLRDDWLRRRADLEKERRALAERTLAWEEHRQEFLKKSPNPEAAEQRLEQLRLRWAEEFLTAAQPLIREHQNLAAEASRLEQQYAQWRKDAADLSTREADLSHRETEMEHGQAQSETELAQLRQESHHLRLQKEILQRQLHELNDVVERLARALIDETEDESFPMIRAA